MCCRKRRTGSRANIANLSQHQLTVLTSKESQVMKHRHRRPLGMLVLTAACVVYGHAYAQKSVRSNLKSPRQQLDDHSGFSEEKTATIEAVEKFQVPRGVSVIYSGGRIVTVQEDENEDPVIDKRSSQILEAAKKRLNQTLSYLNQQVREAQQSQRDESSETVRDKNVVGERNNARESELRAQKLLRQAQDIRAELAELRQKFGEDHPQVRAMNEGLELVEKLRQTSLQKSQDEKQDDRADKAGRSTHKEPTGRSERHTESAERQPSNRNEFAERRDESSNARQVRQQAAELRRRLAELQEHLGSEHPAVRDLQKRLHGLETSEQRQDSHDGQRIVREQLEERELQRNRQLLRSLEIRERELAQQLERLNADAERPAGEEVRDLIHRAKVELQEKIQKLTDAVDSQPEVRDRHVAPAAHEEEFEGHHHDPRQHRRHKEEVHHADGQDEDHDHHHIDEGEHRHDRDEHHEYHQREREHSRAHGRDHEEEHHAGMERVRAMHEAAERLAHGGLEDMAHELHRRAEEMEQDLHQHHGRENHPEELLHEIMENMDQLRREVRELNEKMNLILRRMEHRPAAATRVFANPVTGPQVEWRRIEVGGNGEIEVIEVEEPRKTEPGKDSEEERLDRSEEHSESHDEEQN